MRDCIIWLAYTHNALIMQFGFTIR